MKKGVVSKAIAVLLIATIVLSNLPLFVIPTSAQTNGFVLYDGTELADIYVDSDSDFAQVIRAVGDLKQDINSVTGSTPRVLSSAGELSRRAIIVGTVGRSEAIDQLVGSRQLDVSDVAGQWEAFTIKIIENPFENIDSALVIAGSDKRGTIYGIYEVSQQIGVSPWHWWGDVPIIKRSQVILDRDQIEMVDKPDVKYRGIFINDEANFEYWSRHFENDTDSPGTPNAATYAKVFELLLRLKANLIWPAMHEYSDAFNAIINPETGVSYNAEMADRYGIIVGSSHCEILLRNNATEWVPWCEQNAGKYNLEKVNNDWKASYDYTVNPEAMEAYWEEAVARNYKFENLYTIGLRGVHDAAINCRDLEDKSIQGKAGVVKSAVEAQLRILKKYEEKYKQETGQDITFPKIYCAYKEAAEYFQYDLSLPSDTIIVWADDNHGYVRQFGTDEELSRFPDMGVYYHISYLGAPVSYLWLATTPLGLIYEEMLKAYNAGSDDCWILNVGDIKPGEIPTEFFLTMAWDHDRYNDQTIPEFIKYIAERDFGLNDEDAATVAEILDTYYAVSSTKRPEFQGKDQGPEYSIIHYGDEAQLQINRMKDACDKSDRIYNKLPDQYKDAYFQLVHYMVRASRFTLEKHIYQQKNQLYLTQGRFASVNAYADASVNAHRQILADLKYYNKVLSDGKWDGIMDPYNGTRSFPTISSDPKVTYVSRDMSAEGIGSVCEGQTTGGEAVTLEFNLLTDDKRFIDVFNTGLAVCDYTIQTGEMINIVKADGSSLDVENNGGTKTFSSSVEVEDRLIVSIDWDKVGTGVTNTSIVVKDNFGFEKTYPVKLTKPAIDPYSESTKGYFETNGEVAIEAEHYSKSVAVNGMEWRPVSRLGRGITAMKNYPDLTGSSPRIDQNYQTESPYLEYNIYFETTGNFEVSFYRVPTLNEGSNKTNRTAFQFNNGAIHLFRGNSLVGDEHGNTTWRNGVREHIEVMRHTINVPSTGWHTIRIYRCDAGTMFDRIVLRNTATAAKPSVLGAPEGFTTTAEYTPPDIGVPPVFFLDDIQYAQPDPNKKFLFDFSANAAVANAGYIGIDNATIGSAVKGYKWDAATFGNVKAITRNADKAIRDQGFVYGNSDADITIYLPKAGKYVVGFAMGDRQSGGMSINNMSVKANGQLLFSGFNLESGRLMEKGFVVDVDDNHLKLEFSGSPWILNALEIAPYTQPNQDDGTGAFRPDGFGYINIEAEAALENSDYAWIVQGRDAAQSKWVETYGISGTGMYSGPNMGNNFSNTNYNSNSGPKLHYKINFPQAGNYNMWVLAKSQADADDSIIISLNQSTGIVLNDTKDTGGEFRWFKVGSQIYVPTAGEHVLSIWEREDGFVFDKFVLSQNSAVPVDLGGKMCREGASVDRSELDTLIAKAEGLNPDNYLKNQFDSMLEALDEAKNISSSATQSEIDAAVAKLSNALDNMIELSVIKADAKTGLVGRYEFDDWGNSLNKDQHAVPAVVGNAAPPLLVNDAERGSVVKINPGGTSNYSMVKIPNPLYGDSLANGMTISFWAKGVSAGNYEMWWTATDNFNFMFLSGGLYMGYIGSRGYIDVNKDNRAVSGLRSSEWNLLTMTVTDSEMALYVNGKQYLTSTDLSYTSGHALPDLTRVTDLLRQAKTIELGGKTEYWGSGNFYADDFTIYNHALTAEQVAKLALYEQADDPTVIKIVNVIDLINALPAVDDLVSPDHKQAVDEAKAAYNALSEDQKAVIDESLRAKLDAAVQRIRELEYDEAYNFVEIILNLPPIDELSLEHAPAVEEAKTIYETLSAELKSIIEAQITEIFNQAVKKINQLYAQQVIELIDALPAFKDITLEDTGAIQAARSSYDALAEDAKSYVTNLLKLKAAETRIWEIASDPEGYTVVYLDDLDVVSVNHNKFWSIKDKPTFEDEGKIIYAAYCQEEFNEFDRGLLQKPKSKEELQSQGVDYSTLTIPVPANAVKFITLYGRAFGASTLSTKKDGTPNYGDNGKNYMEIYAGNTLLATATHEDGTAKLVECEIPGGTTQIVIRSYIGEHNWFDHIIFGRARFLVDENKDVDETIAAIDSIGTVTYKSGAAIKYARGLYDGLLENKKELVSNREILFAAEQTYEQIIDDFANSINITGWTTNTYNSPWMEFTTNEEKDLTLQAIMDEILYQYKNGNNIGFDPNKRNLDPDGHHGGLVLVQFEAQPNDNVNNPWNHNNRLWAYAQASFVGIAFSCSGYMSAGTDRIALLGNQFVYNGKVYQQFWEYYKYHDDIEKVPFTKIPLTQVSMFPGKLGDSDVTNNNFRYAFAEFNYRVKEDGKTLGIPESDVEFTANDTLAYQKFIGPDGEAYIAGKVENFYKSIDNAFVVNGEILDVVLALAETAAEAFSITGAPLGSAADGKQIFENGYVENGQFVEFSDVTKLITEIDDLPEVEEIDHYNYENYEAKVDELVEAYEKLSAEQKAEVHNSGKLLAISARIEKIKEDWQKANEVIYLIDLIPLDIVYDNYEEAMEIVKAARQMYDALTEVQKSLVYNIDYLEDIEKLPPPIPLPEPIRGDVDGDGRVTVTDIVAVRSHIMGKSKLEDSRALWAANADEDEEGNITVADIIAIRRKIMGQDV
ncbi:MAG TPA: hypothetical protein GXX17_03725 [Clostridiales bacterium]|nr:hypothetical protein [Clostridiales bacterium]